MLPRAFGKHIIGELFAPLPGDRIILIAAGQKIYAVLYAREPEIKIHGLPAHHGVFHEVLLKIPVCDVDIHR